MIEWQPGFHNSINPEYREWVAWYGDYRYYLVFGYRFTASDGARVALYEEWRTTFKLKRVMLQQRFPDPADGRAKEAWLKENLIVILMEEAL